MEYIFMKIKRLLVVLLALALTLSVGLALTACGGGDKTCEHVDANTDGKCDSCSEPFGTCAHEDAGDDGTCDKCGATIGTENGSSITLVSGGAPTFQVVVGTNARKANNIINQFIEQVGEYVNGDISRVYDLKTNEQEIEIIIGSVANRGAEFQVDEHELGHKGYAINVIGTKLQVLAGSTEKYEDALEYVVETIFGIDRKTDKLTDVTADSSKNYKVQTTGYNISKVTIAGNNIKEYVIAYDDNGNPPVSDINMLPSAVANDIQTSFYQGFGTWLEVVPSSELEDGQKYILLRLIDNGGKGTTPEGYHAYVDGDNMILECEFPEKFRAPTEKYLITEIIESGRSTVAISATYDKRTDVRNIYYSDFKEGAQNDFFMIKACHDYANKWGHVANANPGAKYYIDKNTNGESIVIQTDTNWNGCKFTFDDSALTIQSKEWNAPIFIVKNQYSSVNYSKAHWDSELGKTVYPILGEGDAPITSLRSDASNIGFAPGYKALVTVYDHTVSHYKREGQNANDGDPMHEILLVSPDGTIDTSTPVQWDYVQLTHISVQRVDDDPITISGYGEEGARTLIETIFNGNESRYAYCSRNIKITRSNVFITGVEHIITGQVPQDPDGDGKPDGSGSPYHGFTAIESANNVTVDNFIFQCPDTYYVVENGMITTNNMGTYEMNVTASNAITYQNCTQSNFFQPDGSVKFKGLMGTNYCKNLKFDNMFVCSFDAHCGVYNATIKNSTCEHLNFIGDGLIKYENVTVYADATYTAINLRTDYGSTWAGDVEIDGLDLRYTKYNNQSLIKGTMKFTHDFGYQCYLPQNITIKNVTLTKYVYKGLDKNGNRIEEELSVNQDKLYLFTETITNNTNYIDSDSYVNPIIPTQSVTVINESVPELQIVWPNSPSFNGMDITIDKEEYTIYNGKITKKAN